MGDSLSYLDDLLVKANSLKNVSLQTIQRSLYIIMRDHLGQGPVQYSEKYWTGNRAI